MNKKEEDIFNEAKERFAQCESYESQARANYLYDYRFANADSTNMFQWPDELARSRGNADKPCLTVNKVRQHNLQIINDARQNESSIEIRPTGNGATFEAATILEGIIRHIEYESNAEAAYSCAQYTQVTGGIGYWRVVTDYESDNSFDQNIKIQRVADPLSIYLDPDIQQYDGSDAKFGFVFRDMSKHEYDNSYGDSDEIQVKSPLGVGSTAGWEDDDHVRICEYYRIVEKKDRLHELQDGSTVKESDVKQLPDSLDGVPHMDKLKNLSVRTRDILSPKVEWYLIAGSNIIDKKDWAGKYIPIVRCVGEETVIDHKMDRRGHTRSLIDIQRMYNYWTSSAVEHVALQTKTPYIGAVEAIEGYEEEWRNANLEALTILPYNSMRDDGTPIPKPEREVPPTMAPAYLSGLKITQEEFMLASGQYEANLGAKSNEVSGKAVAERQRAGDRSTYHFIDHFSQAIRFTGRIIVDLIPHIYDTERVTKILGQDGTQKTVKIDPNTPQAHQQVGPDKDDKWYDPSQVSMVLNPNIGMYSVEADIGPSFATQRQETFNALTEILKSNTALMPVVGDLLFRAADFPLADEIAERLKNMVPKEAMGDAQPDPHITQLQQQLAQQHQAIQDMTVKLQQAQSKVADHALQKDIDWYTAETARMAVVGKIDPNALMPIIRQMVSDVLGTPANPVIAEHAMQNEMMHGSNTHQTAMQHAHELNMSQQSQANNQQAQASDQAHQQNMQAQTQGQVDEAE